MNNSVKKKVIKASVWTIAGYVVSQTLRFSGNLILTRLLIPEMFALMAVVSVIQHGVLMCSEIGLQTNIIRHKRGEDDEFLNTAWTIEVIRGWLSWFIMIAIAGTLNSFQENSTILDSNSVYYDANLPLLIMITGFSSVITGFSSTKLWLAKRSLQLSQITIINLLTQVFSLSIIVIWTYFDRTIWPMVYGGLISSLLFMLSSHLYLKGKKNSFFFDKNIAKELFKFGKWMFLSAVFTFFALNSDRLILAKLMSSEMLGIYMVAFFLIHAIKMGIRKYSASVIFPLLSQLNRDSNTNPKDFFYKIRNKQDILIFFIAGFLYIIAPLIVDIFYDSRYEKAGQMLQILSISLVGVSYSLGNTMMTTIGHPYVGTIIVLSRAILLWASVPFVFMHYGLMGAIWAISANIFIEVIIIWGAFLKFKMINWVKEIYLLPLVGVGYGIGYICIELYKWLNQ